MLSPIQKLLRPFCRYQITLTTISIRQDGRWVDIAKSEISAIKVVSVSRVIVRFYNGQRYLLNLFRFSWSAHNAITQALRNAAAQNRETQALWRHAKAFRSRFIDP